MTTGVVTVTMDEYHANLRPIKIMPGRKKDPQGALQPGELKQLRALLGSLQWLVAQVRLDMGYHLTERAPEREALCGHIDEDQRSLPSLSGDTWLSSDFQANEFDRGGHHGDHRLQPGQRSS